HGPCGCFDCHATPHPLRCTAWWSDLGRRGSLDGADGIDHWWRGRVDERQLEYDRQACGVSPRGLRSDHHHGGHDHSARDGHLYRVSVQSDRVAVDGHRQHWRGSLDDHRHYVRRYAGILPQACVRGSHPRRCDERAFRLGGGVDVALVKARVRKDNNYGGAPAGMVVHVDDSELKRAPWCLELYEEAQVA